MEKPYAIRVSSQKGGVGKSTTAVNLAVALGMLNYRVLLVDMDFESPAIGFFLGLESVNIGIADVMHKRVEPARAIVRHNISGINVLPGAVLPNENPSEAELKYVLGTIMALKNYDFIIVDTPPGITYHRLVELYDEALIISVPTMVSVANSIKLDSIYNKYHVVHNLVLNRASRSKSELDAGEIEEGYGSRPIVSLPEDRNVQTSEAQHIPLWILDRKSPFCESLRVLVKFYASKKGSTVDREPGTDVGARAAILRYVRRLLGFGN